MQNINGWIILILCLFFFLLIILFQFPQELCFGFHHIGTVTSAFWAIPFSLRFGSQGNTWKMKPFYWTQVVVAHYHLTVGNLITQTVSWFIGINDRFFFFWRRLFLLACFPLFLLTYNKESLLKQLLIAKNNKCILKWSDRVF